eukprot:693684_1
MQHNQPIESSQNAVEMESNQPIESSQNAVEMESSISSDDDQELHRVDISQLQVNNNDPEDLPSQSQQSIDEENDCDEENEQTPSAKNTATKPTRTHSHNQSHKPTSYVSTTVDIDDEGMNTPHSINRRTGWTARTNTVDTEHHIEFKCDTFFRHAEVIGRVLLLILNLLLLMLSAAYCLGQLYGYTLDLVKQCDGLEMEEIWEHSYRAGLMDNGEVQMSLASQWGITTEPCITNKTLD